jgi:hypothetical protein
MEYRRTGVFPPPIVWMCSKSFHNQQFGRAWCLSTTSSLRVQGVFSPKAVWTCRVFAVQVVRFRKCRNAGLSGIRSVRYQEVIVYQGSARDKRYRTGRNPDRTSNLSLKPWPVQALCKNGRNRFKIQKYNSGSDPGQKALDLNRSVCCISQTNFYYIITRNNIKILI